MGSVALLNRSLQWQMDHCHGLGLMSDDVIQEQWEHTIVCVQRLSKHLLNVFTQHKVNEQIAKLHGQWATAHDGTAWSAFVELGWRSS